MKQVQSLPYSEIFKFLHTRIEGLGNAETEERLRELGPNSIEIPEKGKWIKNIIKQFTNFFTILLFIAAGMCFIAESVEPGNSMNVLGWALFFVAFVNAAFSFLQEYRAEKAMEELKKFLPQKVRVRRNSVMQEIDVSSVVTGDILILAEGDRVPADARVFLSESLIASNAALTGEFKPIFLSANSSDTTLLESKNIAFTGSTILGGAGEAAVFATGLRTEFGKIAHLSHHVQRPMSPLEIETNRMIRILTIIAVSMGIFFFLYGVFSGRSVWMNLVFMLGIIVANVPEGLLPTFTLSLAMGSLRMAKKNVLVKGLNAIEALGAVHVIATDKTGTLTQNHLRVVATTDFRGEPLDGTQKTDLMNLALLASKTEKSPVGYSGDPLDVAIAEFRDECIGNAVPESFHKLQYFPFDTAKRRAAFAGKTSSGYIFSVKGAWESLRPFVSHFGSESAGENEKKTVDAAVAQMASQGLRVIAVAARESDVAFSSQEEWETNLFIAGLIGVEDPLREEVPSAVQKCHRAGIDVLLITGDHPDTALAIAQKAGIVRENIPEPVIHGRDLEKMRESELAEKISNGSCVFARTTPEQKMKIVSALKQMDKVVAMTGDGVNDSPALRAADVGIAMGKSGTDVARQSAQMILLDDNFASIVAGIEEGRTVFANIRKFTNYVLVSNGPEIVPYILYIIFPVPLALNIIHILSIDLGTDILPSMALGSEKPDPEIMQQPPRKREKSALLTWPLVAHSYLFLGLIEAVWSLFLFFLVLLQGGWQYGQSLSEDSPVYQSAVGIALATILLMQIGNLAGRRYQFRSGLDSGLFKNRLMIAGILTELIFAMAILYFPPVQKVMNTGPVDLSVLLLSFAGIPLIFSIDYAVKKIKFMAK